ncbi:hypothetical protein EYF80_030248 [Liparis tanakae]|uniref:Uncharacterized protein n=1 Tax=Liparis tanakae TaxID=230148 RepID=A0A4Z2H3X5_9TELE|nr:hypothetical protein EYF80_030248 [Liparis tanakae]
MVLLEISTDVLKVFNALTSRYIKSRTASLYGAFLAVSFGLGPLEAAPVAPPTHPCVHSPGSFLLNSRPSHPSPLDADHLLSHMMDRYWFSFTMATMMIPPIKVQVGQNREWKTVPRPYICVRRALSTLSVGSTKH